MLTPITGRGTSGITLIEILVVVAIVSFLVLLLNSALDQGRRKAEAASCLVNLKQIYLAETLYAAEHNGRFAPGQGEDPDHPGSGLYGVNHFGLLAPYLQRSPSTDYGQIEAPTPTTKPWRCPSDHRPWKFKEGINWDYDSSYGMNSPGFSSDIPGLPGWPFQGVQMNTIRSPGTVVFFSEMGSNAPYNAQEITKSTWMPSDLAWGRHGKFLNVLYADGHVEANTEDQLIPPNGNRNSIWSQ